MQGKFAKVVPAVMLAIMVIITAAVLITYYTGHKELALVIQKVQFYVIIAGALISLFLLFKQRQQKKKAE
jgi:uncharacterized integral membrane protein